MLLFALLILSIGQIQAQISFDSSNLNFNGFPGVNNSTALEFGPDGNLYVVEEDGLVKVYTIQRNGPQDYVVTNAEVLTLVQSIPNHNDDGTADGNSQRQSTGITVAGTSTNPVVYVSSSDRRRGAGGGGGDVNLDTNSGVITELTKSGGNWQAVDIVRGLPRSEENHATNGLQFRTISGVDWLIVSSGGFTNAGSPSLKFAYITEYALSGAVLAIDLDAIAALPTLNDGARNYKYDIPTLDDPTRANANGITDPNAAGYDGIDINDPWGGNDGLNMGMLVPGSPVKMFSPGYRNTYDHVITQDGHVYVTDNGANGTWGGFPEFEGDPAQVNNDYRPGEPGSSGPDAAPNSTPFDPQVNNSDHLNLVTTDIDSYTFGSVYGGHPCPVRANVGAGLFTRGTHTTSNAPGEPFTDSYFRTVPYDPNGSGDATDPLKALPANWPPVDPSLINTDNSDFRQPTLTPGVNPEGPDDIIVVNWSNNTNAIAEYTASNFGGVMQGDLIAGKGGNLHRVDRDASGNIVATEQNKFSVSGNALGLDCQGDGDIFPGTIWVGNYNGDNIVILEPNDFVTCILPGETGYDPNGDNDSDGYTNDDEDQNNTDMCSGASQPTDFDGDLISDLLDLDDDGDGINDNLDPLQLGTPFNLPVINELFLGTPLGGYLGLGFTGLMNNGDANPNYLDWQDDPNASTTDVDDILGGAIGAITMYQTTGDATNNTQEKAYQYGINTDSGSGSFTVHGRMFAPFHTFSATESQGMFIGDGFQDDYVKLVLGQNDELSVVGENNGVGVTYVASTDIGFNPGPTTENLDLFFVINSATGSVQARYQIDAGSINDLGAPFTLQGDVLTSLQSAAQPLVVGIIGTADTDDAYGAAWDFLNVAGAVPFITQTLEDLNRIVNDANELIGLDAFFNDDGGLGNLTFTVESNTNPSIGASVNGTNLTLTYPATPTSTVITIRATDTDNLFVEQSFTVNVNEALVPILRIRANGATITATDAPNPDWIGITAGGAQGGTFNGITYNVNTGNLSTHNISGSHPSVPSYVPQAIFANERWDPGAAPEMEWTFGLPNGNYLVRLYMGNGHGPTGTPGTRVYDISIEGQLVEDNLDLITTFGDQLGGMLEYPVTLTDGTINVLFEHFIENPLINGIEILGAGSSNPPITIATVPNQINNLGDTPGLSIIASGGSAGETFTYAATGLPPGLSIEPTNGAILGTISANPNDAMLYNVAITVSKPSSAPAVANFTWNVVDPNAVNSVIYRINTGGDLTNSNDASPVAWEEDQSAGDANGTATTGTPSTYVNTSAEDITFGATLPGSFVNTTGYPTSLFSTERYNTMAVPDNMQWAFPVANGTYTVNLLFAEIWSGEATSPRVFDVNVEGVLQLDDYRASVDGSQINIAKVETMEVSVVDGVLNIDFIQGTQNPSIKAIEIISASPPVSDVWTAITNFTEHTPRHENSVVQVGDKFYLFGGRENSDKIDIYNYQTDTWTEAASTAPFEFNHFQATEYQGLIWVIGSFKDNGFPDEAPADNIFIYDPIADSWMQGPAIPAGRKRGSAGLVLYNDKFYVIAGNTIGHNGGYVPWFDEFDPATGVWTTLTDAPHSRDHFHATVVGDRLYAAGGRLSGGTGGTFAPLIPEVDVYDFTTGTWLPAGTVDDLPNARAASSTVSFQNQVVVIGGEGGGQAYVNTDALNVGTGNWSALADLNNARHGTQAVVSGDGIWITSGSPNQGGGNQNNMEVYGTDNPSGSPLVAGALSGPASMTVPTTSTETIILDNTGGNQGIFVTDISFTGADATNFNVFSINGTLVTSGSSFVVPSGGSSAIVVAHTGTVEGELASLDISYGSSSSLNISLTSGAAPSAVLYRVNAGGDLVNATDAPNPDWSVDTGTFGDAGNSPYLTASTTPGGVYNQSAGSAYQGPIVLTHPSIPAGTPAELFQTERFDPTGAPEMTWAFPVDPGTEVEVRLYFAELFSDITAGGQRVFDVSVEGAVPAAFTGIDPFGTAGALGAIMVSHTVTVSDGTLDLVFIHGGENPALKAIELIDVSISGGNQAPVVTNPGAQQSVEGDVINLPILASDIDPCTGLTYQATNLPPSLTIDPVTGIISGTLDEGSGSGTPGAFIESGGVVIIEAETDFVDTAGGWNPLNEGGSDFLEASSNHFGNLNGQNLDYDVEISTPGVYRFFMKSDIGPPDSTTDRNDTWFKINNTPDVHFFCVQGGALSNSQQFFDELSNPANTTKTLYWPAGNAQGRPDHGNEGPGVGGYFKVYTNTNANTWATNTIDNNAFPIYAYFPNPGTFTISMSERSAGHRVDRIALIHIDDVSNGVPTSTLNGPESQQAVGGTPGASEDSPYNVSVSVSDGCTPALNTVVNFTWNVTEEPIGNPAALVQVTAGSGLTSSTFGNDSFLLTNTGDDNIVNVTITTPTGYMMDVVFDPVGTAGDNGAKCLTAGGAGNTAAEVGITVPANGGSDPEDCVSVFALPHNGVNNDEGYDQLTLDFTDFNPGESFAFGVDMDPTSIKGDLTAGDAGSISGFEIIGATVAIEFASGVVYTSSLFDEGSLGGSDAIVDAASNALIAPVITVDGLATNRLVSTANQVVTVNGEPNAFVTLLRVDGRLYIDPGNPNVGYDVDPFEANEAMTKELYTIQLDGSGVGTIPVVLTQSPGAPNTPDGGINHFIAVTNGANNDNSIASNVIVLEFDPNAVLAPSALVEITPGMDVDASTFSASSFQITNTSTGGSQITSISIDLSTGILPDMVFDPTGSGGDATASPFTPNTGATEVGLVVPANPAVDPFSQPRQGGFDIITVNFTEFDPGEYFDFTTDVDPNSIQGVPGAGAAGAVSGYELTGATITINFSDGTTLISSLYEDGSLGGGQAIIAEAAPATPSISVVGVGTGPATVNSLNQVVTITGNPGDNVSLLNMDSRLYIASGDPPFNVPVETYYANEAMSGKTLYTGVIGAGGTVDIPITLLETTSGDAGPDGGLNQLVAVTSLVPYTIGQQVSMTSNVISLLYDPNAVNADLTINYSLQGRAANNYGIDLRVDFYEQGSSTPLLQFTPTGSSDGVATVNGIPPGTYLMAVKTSNHLQRVQTVILADGPNTETVAVLNAGDANDDNFVTLADFTILSQSFNLQTGDPGFDARADFNGDGFVTLPDFSLLSGNFNTAGEDIP
ncbi:putative Ig domain-containing protein [Muriicola sp. Z0-33]|nr:putative Ig domain-containing protein [Muriicola sp. Z0-33]